MARKNKTPESPEVATLKDRIAGIWISIISLTAFSLLGLWMLLDPSSPEHSSVEKGSVYVMKEIWSWQAGALICVVTLPLILKAYFKVRKFKGFIWTKVDNGFYFFDNKKRIAGLASIWDGEDLMIFYPEKNLTLNLHNYTNSELYAYQKAIPNASYNCQDAYWNASSKGYYLFYEGKLLTNLTGEYQDSDFIVSAEGIKNKFKFANYNENLDGKTRKADLIYQ